MTTKKAALAALLTKQATQDRVAGRFAEAHQRAEQAARLHAELAGEQRCRECGRKMTDPESIARGIGPECFNRKDTHATRPASRARLR